MTKYGSTYCTLITVAAALTQTKRFTYSRCVPKTVEPSALAYPSNTKTPAKYTQTCFGAILYC